MDDPKNTFFTDSQLEARWHRKRGYLAELRAGGKGPRFIRLSAASWCTAATMSRNTRRATPSLPTLRQWRPLTAIRRRQPDQRTHYLNVLPLKNLVLSME